MPPQASRPRCSRDIILALIELPQAVLAHILTDGCSRDIILALIELRATTPETVYAGPRCSRDIILALIELVASLAAAASAAIVVAGI